MGRLRISLPLSAAAAIVAALLLAGGPAAASPAGNEVARAGFVKHSGPNWVWFGPRSWDAVYSAYGITIFGSDGSSIDYGGSSILCDGAPPQHFAGQRRSFANNPGLKQVRLRKVSNVRRNGGTYSQTMKFTARANGTPIGGTLGFQYASYDGTYCYAAALYKAAVDDRDFRQSMQTVEAVWDRTAYSGPGLPINPQTGLP